MGERDPATKSEIRLARAEPFRLGQVEVVPATRQMIRGERSETIEPRVMQVLVALAEAEGTVLSRDELFERCWEGRIVSEDAMNRVISRIRQVAADLGMGSFQIETITKVGYRLVVVRRDAQPVPASELPAPWPERVAPAPEARSARRLSSRRLVLAGTLGAIGAVGTSGLVFWKKMSRHQPPPQALELFRRGTLAQRQGLGDQVRQAVSFFKQAVAEDPLYAEAWGALALAYRHILEGFGEAEQESLPQPIQSAAQRALALDPDNADAQLALMTIEPYYRHWARMERDMLRLAERNPDHWLLQAQIGLVQQDVGRLDDGITHSQRVIEIDPFLPIAHAFLARALSCARRIQEADAVLERALARWPAHPFLWNVRFNMLMFSGRPGSAAAFVSDPEKQPEGLGPNAVPMRLRLAKALEGRRPADIDASITDYRELALNDVSSIPIAAAFFALLERSDLAFSSLERYFFGTGGFGDPIPPPSRYDRRYTIAFFAPPLAPYRSDPRYQALLDRTGLSAYWRETGTVPDFRRGNTT